MSTYYTSKYSGEQIDEAVKKIMDGEMTGDYADRQLSNLDTPQAALANLGAGVRPNIARNPAFAVNQRNFTSDNWTSGYGPDGWDSMGSGYLTFNGSTICCYGQYICQRYETGVIKKGKYTVSALCDGQIYAEMGYWESEIAVYAISTNYQNGIASVTLDIPSDNDEVMGYIYIHTVTSGGEITYVKIEQGSTQTLAYQDSTGAWHLLPQPESDYATQLAKCQRYFRRFPANYAMGVLQSVSSVKAAFFRYECIPPMRTTPVLLMQNQSDLTDAIDDGTSPITPTKVVLGWRSNENVIGFYFEDASGNGGPGFVCNRYIDASAEL